MDGVIGFLLLCGFVWLVAKSAKSAAVTHPHPHPHPQPEQQQRQQQPSTGTRNESDSRDALFGMALGGTFDPVFTDKEHEMYEILAIGDDEGN